MARRRLPALAASALALTLLAQSASAANLAGRVVRVIDGDTVVVLVQHKQVRVRLAGIDAPERPGQPFSAVSRDALASVVAGKVVTVTFDQEDQYGRVIGQVDAGGVNANRAQLRAGMAWVYSRFNKNPVDRAIELQARARRAGLWVDPAPVPPWQWRRATK
ncbi:MAG: thermonuclease family protein [Rubrivivax sp.]|nr:thermonuclease family protein [Rubrivivax sp.]MDZ4053054.1 thermonuclease family protein [Phenylobacterium sp.]